MRIKLILLTVIFLNALYGQMPGAVGRRGMVVAGNEVAARFGLNILRRGGNAIDAAIATGFALAVIQPRAGNIGGGGFMVIRLADGTTTSIDFREKAPLSASRDMYLDASGNIVPGLSTDGILASGVPGTVRGYALAHARYGRLSWSTLLTEAINLAENGFAVTYQLHHDLTLLGDRLLKYAETARIFYSRGAAPRLNSLLRQPDLAATLRRIANQGADEFYTGRTAELLVRHMQKYGGLITAQDLAGYEAFERSPVEINYRNVQVITMPPPSAGGVALAEILNLWEQVDMGAMAFHSADHIHAMVEGARRAFADRARYLGDPDFVNVPVESLISDSYARQQWESVSADWATPSHQLGAGLAQPSAGDHETTHFSVVDRQGNAVSVTITINRLYGSGMVVEGAGFFLNDEMDDFAAKPGTPNIYGIVGSALNAIEPGKRMLSSMTPTIVTRGGRLMLVTGSPGGGKIVTTVAQVISNMVDFGFTLPEAIRAKRIHHQWLPDRIIIEKHAISAETTARLQRKGHSIADYEDATLMNTIGAAHSIWVDPETGWYHGVSDARRESGAMGY